MSRQRLTKQDRELRQRIAGNLKKVREALRLTQEELADRSGLHDKHLQKIEYGQVNITLKTLAKITQGLEIDIIELFKNNT